MLRWPKLTLGMQDRDSQHAMAGRPSKAMEMVPDEPGARWPLTSATYLCIAGGGGGVGVGAGSWLRRKEWPVGGQGVRMSIHACSTA